MKFPYSHKLKNLDGLTDEQFEQLFKLFEAFFLFSGPLTDAQINDYADFKDNAYYERYAGR